MSDITKWLLDNISSSGKIQTKETLCIHEGENIISALNKEMTASFEVINETNTAITVALYIPGNVLTGRYEYDQKEKDIEQKALRKAAECIPWIKFVSGNTTEPEEKKEAPAQPVQIQKPADAPVQQQETTQQTATAPASTTQKPAEEKKQEPVQDFMNKPITTAEELNKIEGDVPFNLLDLSPQELDAYLRGKGVERKNPEEKNAQDNTDFPEAPPFKDETPVVSHGFTQRQIDMMKKIKTTFCVTNDRDFGQVINAWNPKFNKKEDLNPENIEGFISWYDALGEFPG